MLIVLFFLLLTCSLNAQSKLWAGLSSDLSGQSVHNAAISPHLIFFPKPNIGVGLSGNLVEYNGVEQSVAEITARYYACPGGFFQGGVITNFDNSTGFSLSAGYTSDLGSRVYIEPAVRYSNVNELNTLGLILGIGIKL